MPRLTKPKEHLVLIFLVMVILTVVPAASYVGSVLWIKKYGIEVKPAKPWEAGQVSHFLQNDPLWAQEPLGESIYNMEASGCLVSVLASVINELGYETTPGELNSLFTEKGLYNAAGEVIWYKIGEVFPGVKYEYKRFFTERALEKALQEGRLPIVKVKYKQTGIFHWVLIVGSDGEDFLVMDPLNQEKAPLSLAVHGKVYAYRVLTKASR